MNHDKILAPRASKHLPLEKLYAILCKIYPEDTAKELMEDLGYHMEDNNETQ